MEVSAILCHKIGVFGQKTVNIPGNANSKNINWFVIIYYIESVPPPQTWKMSTKSEMNAKVNYKFIHRLLADDDMNVASSAKVFNKLSANDDLFK